MRREKLIIRKETLTAVYDSIQTNIPNTKTTVIVRKDSIKYDEPFTIFFQNINREIIRKMRPATAKMLLVMMSEVDYDNIINYDITSIQEISGYKLTQAKKVISDLKKIGILYPINDKNDKRRKNYLLHPQQSWKGYPENRKKELEKFCDNLLVEGKRKKNSQLMTAKGKIFKEGKSNNELVSNEQ